MRESAARCRNLKFCLDCIGAKVLSFGPADAAKEYPDLLEIVSILKPFKELASDVGSDIKNTAYSIGKNNFNFLHFKWFYADYSFHFYSNGLIGIGFCPLTASRQSVIRSSR